MADLLDRLDDCGCCEGVSAQTPVQIANRPGLSAIAYRVGKHSQFKRSLLAALSGAAGPARGEDPAASAALRSLTSRADDDFTIALLDAWALTSDVLTFYQERIANESYLRTATERLSLIEMARLIDYRPNPGVAAGVTLAFTVDAPPASATTPSGVQLPVVAGVPQIVEIPAGAKAQSVPQPGETAQTFETSADLQAMAAWNALRPRLSEPQLLPLGATTAYLASTATNLRAGDVLLFVGSEREADPGSERWDWRRISTVDMDSANGWTKVTWTEGLGSLNPPMLPAAAPKVYALRLRASLFGANAPDPRVLAGTTISNFETSSFVDGEFKKGWKFTIDGQTIHLDNAYPGVLSNSWLVLSKPSYQELYRASTVAESSLTKYAMSGKTTKVDLDTNENIGLFSGASYREVVVFGQSEELPLLAERPLPATQTTGLTTHLKLAAAVDLPEGRLLLVEGTAVATGDLMAETVTLDHAETANSVTTLHFTTALQRSYLSNTVTIYANVVEATQGETVREPLGSGDGSRAYQTFTLKQTPLTHVSDARAEGGAASTLQIRVNDVLWQEASTLYGRGPRERIYVTRVADDGKVTAQFGDGKTGARLPSGAENVRATYRKGIGAEGNVKAGQITTLLTRPQGAREVINPVAANGGEDPEQLEDMRQNAPLTVMTLDRIVSLRDYEDFARAFAGVKKALATWTPAQTGARRGVFVTVAGPDAEPILPDGQTYKNLLAAMRLKGDPHVPLVVKSFVDARFRLAATVEIDPAYESGLVLAAVTSALQAAFSFEARAFGQRVALSEVMAVMQGVAGVVSVDVDVLKRVDGIGGSGLTGPLPAALPNASLYAAELLTIDPAAISLSTR